MLAQPYRACFRQARQDDADDIGSICLVVKGVTRLGTVRGLGRKLDEKCDGD